MTFGNLITAMVTPFDKTQRLDCEKAACLAKKLCDSGSDALLVSGTTGESPTLSHDEKINLFKSVKAAVSKPVIMGTGSNCTENTVEFSREMADLGADGLLLVCPYYNKPPQEGLYRHFASVAEKCEIPIILYDIPGRCGVSLSNDTIVRLHKNYPHIQAVKDAAGNFDKTADLAIKMGYPENKDFKIYCGDDSITYPMLNQGAFGVISVASHVAGKRIKEMLDSFFGGNLAMANKIHLQLMPIFKGLFETTNPILVKEALRLTGFDVGSLRLPLIDATKEQSEKLRNILLKTGCLS